MLAKRIGIDVGATTVLIYVRGQGVVVNEPSPAPSNGDSTLLTEGTLRRLIRRIQGRQRIFKPEVMIGVPCTVTSAERRAAAEAAITAGARQAWLIDKPLAAAIGANLPIGEARGHGVCDIGGRTTEIAVISLSGIVVAQSIGVGGKSVDDGIRAEVKRRHDLFVDDRTAEEIKIAVGSAVPVPEPLTIEVTGAVAVRSDELTAAIQEPLREIALAIRNLLEQAPPHLATDVRERGVVLTGGGALLRGIDRYLAEETAMPVSVAREPQTCVVRGTGLALEHFEVLKRSQLYLR